MFGQIATFAENLHLSYREIFEEIPYRNLLLMSKDKCHVAYGTVIRKASARDMMKRRMGAKKEETE